MASNNRTRTKHNTKPSVASNANSKRKTSVRTSKHKIRKAKTKKTMNASSVIIMAFFVVLITLYFGQAVYSMMTRPDIPMMTVQMGSVDLSQSLVFDGVIIRSERVYASPADGVVNFNYNDLDRVRRDDVICAIWSQREYNIWLEELSRVNSDMLTMQERRGSMSAFEQDVITFNDRIKEYIDEKLYAGINEGVAKTYDIKESIAQSISIRNQMSLSENRGSVQNYYDQKQIFENALSDNTDLIRAVYSGILSYNTDGLESEFTIANMQELTENQIRRLGSSKRASSSNLVSNGDALFRIVESNDWYIAAYIDINQTFEWTKGMAKTIYLQSESGYRELETTIERIDKSEKDAYVIFKATKYMLDFIDMRSVRIKIANSEHQGYKIPNTAIVNKTYLKIPIGYLINATDSDYVLKRVADRDIMIPIKVFQKTDEFFLTTQDFGSLSLGDVIVKDSKEDELTISEVESYKGVYVINNGYAEFRRVVLNDAIPEKNPYTILNPNDNKNIKIFDRIISDSKNFFDGQKIY